MRQNAMTALLLAACWGSRALASEATPAAVPVETPAPASTPLKSDTPTTTPLGNQFVAPAGWTLETRQQALILTPPEGGSHLALVDVRAASADAAVAAAWAAYDPAARRVLTVATDRAARDGWEQPRMYRYETSPNENRTVLAVAQRAGEVWTVVLYDMDDAIGDKRGAQVALVLSSLLPKGGGRESFAGKTAHPLDAEHVAQLTTFVEAGRKELDVPGVAIALVDHDKVVFAGGFGVRELGKPAAVDADTRFIIASNTKALTTLLLARLVDQGKAAWDAPVTSLFPSFRLGNADTTRQVKLEHLVCACTGVPRQDFEWLFEFADATPSSELDLLATIQPTSKFGEMFQYSNNLAAAAGFVGGHLLYPGEELGAAYDRAMAEQVFTPLGMKGVTFDFATALAGNHAGAHGPDVDGKTVLDTFALNYAVVPLRPAGGLWSSADDLIRYVRMELGEGMLDGQRYIGREALLARRTPHVAIGKDATYGMGLMVDRTYGVEVVHHGGDLIGYHSDMIWLPQQQVGAVILTNSDLGPILVQAFRRRLLEVLFDGRPEAAAAVGVASRAQHEAIVAERAHLMVPADAAPAAELAGRYANPALGVVEVARHGAATVFDFGEWSSEVATRKNEDGTISFVTIAPGIDGIPFVPGGSAGKRTLTLRDAQHEYLFTEVR